MIDGHVQGLGQCPIVGLSRKVRPGACQFAAQKTLRF